MKLWYLFTLLVRGNLRYKLDELKIKCLRQWCKMIGINNIWNTQFQFTKMKTITAKMDVTEAEWVNCHNCLVIYNACIKRVSNSTSNAKIALLIARTIMKIEEKLNIG